MPWSLYYRDPNDAVAEYLQIEVFRDSDDIARVFGVASPRWFEGSWYLCSGATYPRDGYKLPGGKFSWPVKQPQVREVLLDTFLRAATGELGLEVTCVSASPKAPWIGSILKLWVNGDPKALSTVTAIDVQRDATTSIHFREHNLKEQDSKDD